MAKIINPIKYVSRNFSSIMADINSDPVLVDKPSWFKKIWAGIGDVVSMWLNSMVNLMFLRTSYTRASVSDLCQLIDYALGAHSTSAGKLLFYVRSDLGVGVFPVVIAISDLVANSSGGLSTSSRRFEARAGVTMSAVSLTATASAGTDLITSSATLPTAQKYTGHKIQFRSSGTVPGGLTALTDYWMIYVGGDTFKVAQSLEDAYAGNFIDITSAGTGTLTVDFYSVAVDCYQQETLADDVDIGSSDGVTEWQEFDLPDAMVLKETLVININSLGWTRVTTFIDSSTTDRHFKIVPLSGNRFRIRFGNGTYGLIPPAFPIIASYAFGGGVNSNISAIGSISSYAGGDANVTAVSNPGVFTGGGNQETIESAKALAPLLLKSRDRFITEEDGEALVKNYGGISLVKINKNFYGPLSAQVLGIANGGGNPSSALRTDIENYLIARTILGSIDVRFPLATITPVNAGVSVKVLPGYSFATSVKRYTELALGLFLTNAGQEIKDSLISSGIEICTSLINTVLGLSLTADDYVQVNALVTNLKARSFGETIQESDVIGYVDTFVIGLDYLNITSFGSGLPITFANDEISDVGVLTVVEI